MLKSPSFISAIIITLMILLSTIINPETNTNMPNLYITDPYNKAWKKVDSLETKGLIKSAKELVQEINEKAKSENNPAQIVKSQIYFIKYFAEIEEEARVKIIQELKKEIEISKHPVRPVLQSILAEMYWSYYTNNRWQFSNRTETVNFDNDDIKTWDLKKISTEVISLYLASIENAENSKKVSIGIFDAILVQGNTRDLRPTLFDFLAHRALDFFMNDETYLTQPSYKFNLTGDAIFGNAKEFTELSLQTKDTFSLKFNAALVLQDLIAFHLNDKSPEALIDVDLKRLSFVRSHAVNDLKDSLHLAALQQLNKSYKEHSASATISYNIANYYYQKGATYSTETSELHKWDKKEALKICEGAIERFPKSYGAELCMQLTHTIKSKNISFNIEKVNVPDQPFRALLYFQNTFSLYGRVIKLDDKINSDFMRKKVTLYGDEILDEILKYPTVKQWEITLPNDGDYQQHTAEILVPKLEPGYYAILIGSDVNFSYDENAVAFAYTHVSNISVINQTESDQSNSFYLLHRNEGTPLKNVTAQLYSQIYNNKSRKYSFKENEKYVTNAEGHFNVDAPNSYRNYFIQFQHEGDRLTLDNQYYSQEYYHSERYGNTKTIFFTDRAIYRPGQTIYFKGIMIKQDAQGKNKILTKNRQLVTLYDVNRQKVGNLILTTNEFGTYSGTFVAPSTGLNGQMSISDGHSSISFSVEEYKRPKFEVGFKPFEGSYKLGDEIKVSGFAKAYAGSTIDGAQVSYRVVREVSFPYWWGYGRLGYPSTGSQEIANGVTTSNEDGAFEIPFKALPDLSIPPKQKPEFSYTVHADVTDVNGETHSNTTHIRLGYITLSVNVGMSQQMDLNEKHTISIHTTNLNGSFEAASGQITIQQLKSPSRTFRKRLWAKPDKFIMSKEEFYEHFPYDVYSNEDEFTQRDIEKEVWKQNFDTSKEKTLNLNNISGWNEGKYLLTLETQDKYGEPITVKSYFDTFSPNSKKLAIKQIAWFRPVEAVTEPGDTAIIKWGSSAKNVSALLEIEHNQVIVDKKWIKIDEEINQIALPVKEKHRGGFQVHLTFVKHNRAFTNTQSIHVPWSNKNLKISFETFRDKLYPGKEEEWKLKISGPDGEKVAAEMVAGMYDASLDEFRPNYWGFNIYPYNYSYRRWNIGIGFSQEGAQVQQSSWNAYYTPFSRYYDQLNWFGFSSYYWYEYNYYGRSKNKSGKSFDLDAPVMMEESVAMSKSEGSGLYDDKDAEMRMADELAGNEIELKSEQTPTKQNKPVQIRKNLNETAFFYPHLQTNRQGEVIVSFTIPEALTRWKFMAFAHTKDLKYGFADSTAVTQKELMVMPNPPRFFREGDTMEFTAKVSNLSDKDLTGTAELKLFDALTMKPIDAEMGNTATTKNFTSKQGQSDGLSWKITIPEGIQAITYRVVAKTNKHSDGEEATLPVLTNRMLVTESLPLPIRGNQTKEYTLKKLIDSDQSKTLKHHNLTLEFTSNPAWYAVQALPYLMEYPYECSEQVFSRFYSNSLASHIANSNPGVKRIFNQWKNTDALLSNLEKNQELKSLMLEETPGYWKQKMKPSAKRD